MDIHQVHPQNKSFEKHFGKSSCLIGYSRISQTYLAVDTFPQEHFEANVHRSCFWNHYVIIQTLLCQICFSLIFIPSNSQSRPIYSRYLINANQMSVKMDLARVAILGETKRSGDGNENIEKSFIWEHYIVVNQEHLHLSFKCKLVIKAACTICTCHTLFPTSSSYFYSKMTVSFLVKGLIYSHCQRGSPMISPKSSFFSNSPISEPLKKKVILIPLNTLS